MIERAKATVPLALVIGVLAFLYVEFSLNFSFHWVTDGALPNGLQVPSSLHLVVPAAFVSWGFFFAAGADSAALTKVTIGSVIGSVGGLLLMFIAPGLAKLPDFWGISLTVGILAIVVVVASALGDWYYVPAVFGAFACVVFWWIATGLDRWAEGGGGTGGLASLAKPATAGAGAFGGVISTPAGWVFFDVLITLLIGCVLGPVSVRLAGMLTPKSAAVERDSVSA